VPSANLGPNPYTTMSEWMRDRMAGKPFASEKWHVDNTGKVNKTPY
jgi:hypothetical protein